MYTTFAALLCTFALTTVDAAETDVVGTFSVQCAFNTKNLLAKGDAGNNGMTDFFTFAGDHSIAMLAFVPGVGSWGYTTSKNEWSIDMSAAADGFFEGMTLGSVTMKKCGATEVKFYGALLSGKLGGKWKTKIGGKTLKGKLDGLFIGSQI